VLGRGTRLDQRSLRLGQALHRRRGHPRWTRQLLRRQDRRTSCRRTSCRRTSGRRNSDTRNNGRGHRGHRHRLPSPRSR
jgi:hypothetical protein